MNDASATPVTSPVHMIQAGSRHPIDQPDDGIALCLSGGGYRAMLFHLGSLMRLNELGYLKKLDRVSSVSGGSITAATLAMNWHALAFDDNGVATAFEKQVAQPIRKLAGHTVDEGAILGGVFLPGSVSD
jgi:NTE family protein